MTDPFRDQLDRIARHHSYEEGFNGRLTRYRLLRFEQALPPDTSGASVLEAGAGEGAVTGYLAERFGSVHAVEPAARFVERLRERHGSRVRVSHSTLEALPGDERYDYAVAAGVLEHVQDAVRFLALVRERLAPGGALLLTVPNAASLHRQVGLRMGLLQRLDELGPLDHKVGHQRYYDAAGLRADLEAAGFVVERLQGILLKPLPNSAMEALETAYCDALFDLGDELPEYCAELFALARPG